MSPVNSVNSVSSYEQETEPSLDLADPPIRIFIVGGSGCGSSFTIKENRAFIGRDFSNDLQLDDQSVSRKHAAVFLEGGRYFIEDLGAKNGTLVNEQAIAAKGRVRVEEGLPILLGNVLISLGKKCAESISIDQHPLRTRGTEESLFDSRLIKYKHAHELIQGLCSSFLKTLDVEKLCNKTLHAIFSSLKAADSGYVLLAEKASGELRKMAAWPTQATQRQNMRYAGGLVEQVLRYGKAMIVPGTEPETPQELSDSMSSMGVKSVLCAPLISRFGTRGVVCVQSGVQEQCFCKEDLFFVNSFAALLMLAIETTLLYEKSKKAEERLKKARYDVESAINERTAELVRAKDEMEELSITDGLTGLYNYRYFKRRLESEFRRAVRYARTMSLLMIDIDYFKNLNDTHGHLCGDFVIKKVAELIKRYVRSTDVAARYGGDELGVILPETNKVKAFEVAEKLKLRIEGCHFEWCGKPVEVRISIGLAEGSVPGIREPFDLLNAADRALYQAKQAGRNMVVAFGSIENRAKEAEFDNNIAYEPEEGKVGHRLTPEA